MTQHKILVLLFQVDMSIAKVVSAMELNNSVTFLTSNYVSKALLKTRAQLS